MTTTRRKFITTGALAGAASLAAPAVRAPTVPAAPARTTAVPAPTAARARR